MKYKIFTHGTGGPDIYWGALPDERDVEQVFEIVKQQNAERAFRLIAYEPNDWNGDFSPWQAPAVFKGREFLGDGEQMLRWLLERCFPQVEQAAEPCCRYLAGYSLAGLFSLWALTVSDAFAGAASCSGSLWFPNWVEYLQGTTIPMHKNVFLSLGESEKNTKIHPMNTVNEATQATYDHFSHFADNITLEWNVGGHFNYTTERTARGISWLVEKTRLS